MGLRQFLGFGRAPIDATPLYARIVAQARQPAFYAAHGVPDTVDGRFDMIALHAFLVLHRLKSSEPGAAELSQVLFDAMFADMDRNLREMGASDLGVGRRVRAMAEGLYGRMAAYEAALNDDLALRTALRRNLFGTVAEPGPDAANLGTIAAYLRDAARSLAAQKLDLIRQGQVAFPDVPGHPRSKP